MSQFELAPEAAPASQTNALAVAGLTCSVIGLILNVLAGLGAVLCVIGLLMCLVALGRPPRGMAIAGVVVGLLGTCLGAVFLVFVSGAAAVGLGLVLAVALSDMDRFEITADMIATAIELQQYQQVEHGLPESLDELSLPASALLDPWGNAYQYTVIRKEPGFELVSAGPDGEFDTADDVALSRLDEAWDGAFDDFKEKMRQRHSVGGRAGGAGDEADRDDGGDP
jgi:hypothetical protein